MDRPESAQVRLGKRVAASASRRAAGLLVLCALAPAGAAAQSVTPAEQAIAATNTILQRFTPPPRVGSVDITVEDQRARVTDAAAARIRLTLRSVTIEGARTVPPDALAPIWRDRLGTEITVAELYGIAAAVDAAYERAGYFAMTVVPTQDFATGAVRLRVYESYITDVEITSTIPGIERRLRPYIDRIVAMHPIRIREAERILSLMSDLAGLTIVGEFVRPEVPTGAGSLRLDIDFDRATGVVGLDNLGSDEIGPLELAGNVVLNDLLGLFETTTLVAVTVPDKPRELVMLQGSQEFPIGHDGLRLGYSYTYMDVQPGGPARALDARLERRVANAYLSYPFIRSIDTNLFGQIEFTAQDEDLKAGGALFGAEEARWLRASLRYDHVLDTGALSGSFGLAQGIGPQTLARAVPDDYRFATADIDYSRPLSELVTLWIRAAGQYATTPLPGAAQFSIGGDPYGLAFDDHALAGDSGAAAALQLSRAIDTGFEMLGSVSLSALVDYGIAWNKDVPDGFARDTLGSVGIGLTGMLGARMSFELLAATPWDTGDAVEDPGSGFYFRFVVPL